MEPGNLTTSWQPAASEHPGLEDKRPAPHLEARQTQGHNLCPRVLLGIRQKEAGTLP